MCLAGLPDDSTAACARNNTLMFRSLHEMKVFFSVYNNHRP